MKQITGIMSLLWALSATAQAQDMGVGINTENPKGVLHIDGAADNHPTGNISATAADDVVIDTLGRIGIGTATPVARVDIQTGTQGGALRINPGGIQEAGMLLTSDDKGRGRWETPAAGIWWYAALRGAPTLLPSPEYTGAAAIRPFISYSNELISSTNQNNLLNRAAGTITVPSAGRYRITTSIHYGTTRSGNNPYWAKSLLFVNGNIRWYLSTWGARQGLGIYPTYTTILNLEAGDVLQLALDQREDPGLSFCADQGTAHVFMVELIQLAQ
jgi:hypothetical protein